MWDGAGNDEFRANGWAGGSGAHFCIGVLVDDAGDDLHRVAQNWGLGYGHDFTVGIHVDGGGDDRYEAGEAGIGWSINRSVGLLVDVAGDDRYGFAKAGLVPGTAVFDARFLDRSGVSALYWTESRSVGLFVDGAGTDVYPSGASDGDALTDAPTSDNARAHNLGIRLDVRGATEQRATTPLRRCRQRSNGLRPRCVHWTETGAPGGARKEGASGGLHAASTPRR